MRLFKRLVMCRFWGCQPPDDGSWWTAPSGQLILTKEQFCVRCKRKIPVS